MSTLLGEVYQLRQIQRIRTTPYHPQTDGLVEGFNGTLKMMLRKFVSSNQKDWDEFLPYLLFTYREVPQKSTGFSPFELLYGQRVRGPLDVLRESWTGDETEDTTAVLHVLEMKERLEGMSTLVKRAAVKAQQRQKMYDRSAMSRNLDAGDKVLVLLPMQRNLLKLEWVGPYTVTRKVTPVDYEVETPGRQQERKVYHVNLLNQWYPANPEARAVCLAPSSETDDAQVDLDIPITGLHGEADLYPISLEHVDLDVCVVAERLSDVQQRQLKVRSTRGVSLCLSGQAWQNLHHRARDLCW